MKNKLFLIFSMILLVAMFANLTKAADNFFSCNPTIAIVNQDPIPAIPDSYVKVIFEVSNMGNCNGFAVKLDPQYPFSLDPGVDPTQAIQNSPYAPDYRPVWDVPYKIRVAQDALEGDYNLKLIYKPGSTTDFGTSSSEKSFNLSIVDSQTDFATVIQDTSGSQLSLGVVNTGKNTANSLIVSIPQQPNYAVTGTSQQIVGNLAAGDYTIVSFSITQRNTRNIPTNATRNFQPSNFTIPGNFSANQLTVQLDYTDGIGQRRTVTKQVQYNVAQGNLTSRFGAARPTTTSSSKLSAWNYLEIIIVIIAVILIYRKYNKGIKNSYDKLSKNIPDWVAAERTKSKK